jgi:quinol monooxygenase YgiN
VRLRNEVLRSIADRDDDTFDPDERAMATELLELRAFRDAVLERVEADEDCLVLVENYADDATACLHLDERMARVHKAEAAAIATERARKEAGHGG